MKANANTFRFIISLDMFVFFSFFNSFSQNSFITRNFQFDKKNAVPLESHIANISPERDYGPNLSEADYARPIYLIRFELI